MKGDTMKDFKNVSHFFNTMAFLVLTDFLGKLGIEC